MNGWTEEDADELEDLRGQLAASGYAVAANVRAGNIDRARIETERYFQLDARVDELNRKWQDDFYGRHEKRAET